MLTDKKRRHKVKTKADHCTHKKGNPSFSFLFFQQLRIERIHQYGGMPYSQTKERFLQGISVPRNLSLMRVFQGLEITEKTGHGTVKIISAYGKEVFDIQDGFIQVTIPFNKKVMKNRDQINDQINDQITELGLSILRTVSGNPGIKADRIHEILSSEDKAITLNMVRNSIKRELRNYIELRGSRKTGGYYLKEIIIDYHIEHTR